MHTKEEHQHYENMAIKGALLFYENRGADEESLISALAIEFGGNLTARMICYFLPIAFGWVLLKRMGVTKFPSYFTLLDKYENEVEFKVSEQSIFMGALTVAFKVFEHGYTETLTKEVVTEIINHSAEVDAANRALNSGDEIAGSEVSSTHIYSIKAEELMSVSS